MEQGNFQELYAETLSSERETKARLIQFEQSYPGVLDESNVDAVTESIQRKSDRASIIKSLLEKQSEPAAPAPKRKFRTRSDHER